MFDRKARPQSPRAAATFSGMQVPTRVPTLSGKTHDVREHTMPRRSPNGAEPRRTDHFENHSQTIDAEMRRERSKADPTAQRLGFTTAMPFKPHTPRSSLKGWLIGPKPAERAMRTYTSWGILVMPAASLVDKGKPDVSRGRKATGPTRSAELPDRRRSPMSPTDAGRFTNAATVSHTLGPPIPSPPGGEHASVQGVAASEGALATDPPPFRPVTAARVGPSRNLHPRPYNDPCNYLG